jgi:hypothetical protein
MSQKQRDKQQRREARKQKGHKPGLSPAQRQAAYEERCAKRKAHELKLKELAEAERARQRAVAQARESALADALASASVPAEGGELRLLGLHDTRRYNYPTVVQISGIDFIVADVHNSDGDTWLSLKPKPQPKPIPQTRPPLLLRGRFNGHHANLALAAALMGVLDHK